MNFRHEKPLHGSIHDTVVALPFFAAQGLPEQGAMKIESDSSYLQGDGDLRSCYHGLLYHDVGGRGDRCL